MSIPHAGRRAAVLAALLLAIVAGRLGSFPSAQGGLLVTITQPTSGSTVGGTVTVTVFNDLIPPSVAITAPGAGSTVSGTTAVTANATDNTGVVGVQFFVD